MDLIINGEQRRVEAGTVRQLISELELDQKMIVVEIDGQVIDKSDWADTRLESGMRVELLHFVGGG